MDDLYDLYNIIWVASMNILAFRPMNPISATLAPLQGRLIDSTPVIIRLVYIISAVGRTNGTWSTAFEHQPRIY